MPTPLAEYKENTREYYGKRLHNEQMALIDMVMERLRENPELVSDKDIQADLKRINEIEVTFDSGGLDELVDSDVRALTFRDRLELIWRRFSPTFALLFLSVCAGIGANLLASKLPAVLEFIKQLGSLGIAPAYAQATGGTTHLDKSQLTIAVMGVGFMCLVLNWVFWSVVMLMTNKAKTLETAIKMVNASFYFMTGAITGFLGRGGA